MSAQSFNIRNLIKSHHLSRYAMYMYVWMCGCIYKCTYIYIYVHINVHTYTYKYIYIHTYIHIHIYTYIYTQIDTHHERTKLHAHPQTRTHTYTPRHSLLAREPWDLLRLCRRNRLAQTTQMSKTGSWQWPGTFDWSQLKAWQLTKWSIVIASGEILLCASTCVIQEWCRTMLRDDSMNSQANWREETFISWPASTM